MARRRAQEPTRALRMLSLCSGIGGIDLAWEWAGGDVAGQVELDPWRRKVLAKWWPDVPRLADIREVRGDEFGAVDVVAAGFPCPPVSVAGKRRGAADDRWLWPEVLRITRCALPTWVVLENVPGLITLGLDAVLSDLERAGYACGAVAVPAAGVGAPHLRERIFVVAHRNCRTALSRRQALADAERRQLQRRGGSASVARPSSHAAREARQWQWDGHTARDGGEALADTSKGRCAQLTELDGTAHSWQQPSHGHDLERCDPPDGQAEPELGGDAPGIPGWLDLPGWPSGPSEPQAEWEPPRTIPRHGYQRDRTHRLAALGDAVSPAQVLPILLALVEAHYQTLR